MLKISKGALTVLLVIIFNILPAKAETDFLFSPLKVNIDEGKEFNLDLSLNSNEVKNYIARFEFNFPPNLLEITGFSLADNWIIFNQEDRDKIDNENGFLIKTAGYPNGFSGEIKFGTVYFRAKKAGQGIIALNNNSYSLDINNKNLLSNFSTKAVFNILDGIASPQALTASVLPREIKPGYIFSHSLRQRDKNIDVAYLQLCLRSKGFYPGEITGDFDDLTKRGVISLQEKYSSEVLIPWKLSKPSGEVDKSLFFKLDNLCFIPSLDGSPGQLFDINFTLDSARIKSVKNLVSRVSFISFGKVPTPVDLSFKILDETGKEIYLEKDYIAVETEAILTKKFDFLDLKPGKYFLTLHTSYNKDVEDDFSQPFEIKEELTQRFLIILYSSALLILIILLETTRRYFQKKDKPIRKKKVKK